MNTFKPERGIHFAPVIDVSKHLAPPYDVINDQEREALKQLSEFNIVNLVLPDGDGDAKYEHAAKVLKKMLDSGALVRDDEEAFYVYDQQFTLPSGRRVTRRGVIGRLLLEDDSGVLPHEKTLDAPKQDRLKLFMATGVVASQVFTFYADPDKKVEQALANTAMEAVFNAEVDGVTHILYKVTDPEACQRISLALQDKELFIADGHHRFETQRNYRNLRRQETGASGDEPFNYASIYAANIFQEGLVILPINRLLHGLQGFDPRAFKAQTSEFMTWSGPKDLNTALKDLEREKHETPAFVFVLNEGGQLNAYLVTVGRQAYSDFIEAGKLHSTVAALDVSFLHHRVLNDVLHIDPQMVARKEHIEYEHDPHDLFDMMNANGKYQVGIILKPVRVDQIMAVAEAHEKMPQKSTFFYPKLFSGVVIHPLEENVPPKA